MVTLWVVLAGIGMLLGGWLLGGWLQYARRTETESVWLGDMAGFEIQVYQGQPYLAHRCGWDTLDDPGVGVWLPYLGNIVEDHMLRHRREGCDR